MEAPVSASQGAMRSLPMKLESLLSGPEQGLRAEEKKKLRILQGDLQGLIDNYLLEPSEVESPASTASSWMEGVRDLSYDIDDFIYELAHVAGGGARINVVQKPPRFKISRLSEKLRRRQWITDDISGFRTRVQEAIRRHRDYLGSNCKWRPSSSGQSPPPSSPSGEAPIHLVGVDSSIEQLCSWLVNDGQPEHKVASIIGAGGVGKTILAKQVYRKLGVQFECLAFVRASPKADMKGLLTSILSQVRRHRLPDDACDVHNLVLNINAHLQDKSYLIVIEDMWALSTWELVNRSLPKGNRCSRILTTTEVEVIAQTCCADNSTNMPSKKEDKPNYMPLKKENNSRYIIKKEPLSEDESRELFLSTAFGKQAECPQHLKGVSNEIIKRSGGLPLTINILASLLARQPASIEQWNYIKNSLSSTLTTNASLERINQVLNLAYDNLPHGMKACMLYLCLYEEGCIIWKDDLEKQWIAEGFICSVEGGEGEEVARSCFGELVNRGMIQPVDINCNDEILSCTVHHMVLQFIRDKSMEENFCIAVDHSQTTIRLADKVRRLALHFGNVEDATPPSPQSMRLSKLRSVAFSGFPKCMPSIVDFRFLQVLILKLLVGPDKMSDNLTGSEDLSGSITEPDDLSDNLGECDDDLGRYNLTEISELFRLRYFHLDACHISVALPTKMQQLKDLVAWEIDAEVTAVPSDIVDLPGLLYLSIPSEAHLPTFIGCMTSLRTLGVFDLNKNSTETVMSLVELTNLEELRLTCSTLQPGNLEKNLECLGMIVWKLRNLKRVTLVPAVSSLVSTQDDGSSSSTSISWLGFSLQPLPPALLQTLYLSRRCCIFSSLPEWTKELTNLCILKIAVRELSREDITILKGLPSLAALSLFISTAPASRIIFYDDGFLVLKYFKFVCAAPCLAFTNEAMPKVQKIKIGFNANRMKGYSLDDAGFERLMGLTEISIKIRGTGADEHNRMSTQLVLPDAIGKDPRTSTINVQWVDWDRFGDEEMYIEVQKDMGKWTSRKQGMITGESSDEHAIQEKNLEEDTQKHANMRTYTTPESTLHQRNTDLKLSFVKKGTDGIAEKHEVDNDGYGDIFKLLAMLSALGDGRRGRKTWDQLQGMLADVATCIADPAITVEHMLGLLEDARGPSSLHLRHPEAEALLRRIMASLEKETIRVLDTGVAIPRLREVLQVVARQLGMLPLRDSDSMHMVDGDTNFCDANVAGIIKCSPQLSAPNAAYGVVSIVGAQSRGKSYLLNRLFGTKFPEMNAKCGWSQTTRGIMMSRCIGPSLLVLDVEGFDGREKGQDTLFEKQAALFALTVSDVMLVNMSVFDIGREQVFNTIFKERTKLPVGLTNILVVLRMYDGETPLYVLKDDVMKSLEKMWKSVNVESKFEDYIEVNVVGLPDKYSTEFPKEVTLLRRLLSNNTFINRNGRTKVPASSFSISSRRFWDKIKNNEKLDIPSHQEALARLFCRQTADNALKSIDSNEDYKLLKVEESPRRFRDISDTLLGSIVTMYDNETEKYDPKVRDIERQYMEEKLMKVFKEDSRELIRKIMGNTSELFKGEYAKNLESMEETGTEVKYDDTMVDSWVEEFMKSCEDLKVFDSDYLHMKCAELQKYIHLYTLHQILTMKEIRGRKATELAQQRSDKNLEEVLKRLEETVKERQQAEAEITRLKEKQLTDELEYARKMLAEQQKHAEKMLADNQEEAQKMMALQKEQMEKLIAAQQTRRTFSLPNLIQSMCNQM